MKNINIDEKNTDKDQNNANADFVPDFDQDGSEKGEDE